jgi:16S rRNA (cytosine1402-N4)-methyltransferase
VGESQPAHLPVLAEPVVRELNPQPGQVILDGTIGLGGHAALLLPRILPRGVYLGLDLDEQMLKRAAERLVGFGEAVRLFHANYAEFPEVLAQAGVPAVDHMLLDLGVNSAQLADPARGFSFDRDGPLDMRFDQSQQESALDLVNRLSERELSDVFYYNAQETQSRKIARRICQVRHSGRITSTAALARAVESAMGGESHGKIHPATRVFQALRVAVNKELENLRHFVARAADFLKPSGKLAVISFHSLEDGIVKQAFRAAKATGTLEELTKRPIVAEPVDREANPRSRSAKLRVAQRAGGRG